MGHCGSSDHVVLAAIFDGLNRYLGNYIGEFLGELGFSLFFVLSGVSLLRHPHSPRWLGWWGIVTGVAGLIGMWRNVTSSVDLVAEANNYLLPLWISVLAPGYASTAVAGRESRPGRRTRASRPARTER